MPSGRILRLLVGLKGATLEKTRPCVLGICIGTEVCTDSCDELLSKACNSWCSRGLHEEHDCRFSNVLGSDHLDLFVSCNESPEGGFGVGSSRMPEPFRGFRVRTVFHLFPEPPRLGPQRFPLCERSQVADVGRTSLFNKAGLPSLLCLGAVPSPIVQALDECTEDGPGNSSDCWDRQLPPLRQVDDPIPVGLSQPSHGLASLCRIQPAHPGRPMDLTCTSGSRRTHRTTRTKLRSNG